jgi:hypothetical protein
MMTAKAYLMRTAMKYPPITVEKANAGNGKPMTWIVISKTG